LGEWKSVDAAPILLDLHNAVGDERLKGRAIRAYIRIARQFDMPADRRAAMCRTAFEAADRDEDKRLVLEVLLRYPSDEMQAIALEAAKVPPEDEAARGDGLGQQRHQPDELSKALGSHQPVKLRSSRQNTARVKKTRTSQTSSASTLRTIELSSCQVQATTRVWGAIRLRES
jgi:hypothetical protein